MAKSAEGDRAYVLARNVEPVVQEGSYLAADDHGLRRSGACSTSDESLGQLMRVRRVRMSGHHDSNGIVLNRSCDRNGAHNFSHLENLRTAQDARHLGFLNLGCSIQNHV